MRKLTLAQFLLLSTVTPQFNFQPGNNFNQGNLAATFQGSNGQITNMANGGVGM